MIYNNGDMEALDLIIEIENHTTPGSKIIVSIVKNLMDSRFSNSTKQQLKGLLVSVAYVAINRCEIIRRATILRPRFI